MERAQGTSALEGTTCIELALEGERLCKTGDIKNGVRFFEEAIKQGTSDIRIKSAIHSQLGNAYFYLEDYQRAIEHHKQDVDLIHSIGDEAAEAKAYGNLGNTYKMLGKFDEAAIYCRRHLEISRKLNDKAGEGRALYNLGNVYYTQGKRMIGTVEQETCQLSGDVKSSLQRAAEYYESNLKVVSQLKDYAAMGRAYGNLGNMYYMLGSFDKAIDSHERRLQLAIQIGDKPAERRAHLNLGNANVFLCRYREAIENYSATMRLAQELGDKRTEAHACYGLANSHTILRDYKSSIDYNLRYLEIMTDLNDRFGEGLACVSLVNVYRLVEDFDSALIFAEKQSEIAELLGDKTSVANAKADIEELKKLIDQRSKTQMSSKQLNRLSEQPSTLARGSALGDDHGQAPGPAVQSYELVREKRQEKEQQLFKSQINRSVVFDTDNQEARVSSGDDLFDMIASFQNDRFNDQRSDMRATKLMDSTCASSRTSSSCSCENKENHLLSLSSHAKTDSNHTDLLGSSSQDQILRASSRLNSVQVTQESLNQITFSKASVRNLESRSHPAATAKPNSNRVIERQADAALEHRLFDLIAGAQSKRMDEQRASPPVLSARSDSLRNRRDHSQSKRRALELEPPLSDHELRRGQPEAKLDFFKMKSHSPSKTAKVGHVRFQTFDSEARLHDENFLDSLMKYQSTRFDDQRSEVPRKVVQDKVNEDNFFDLIVRFQSDRFDDQRSVYDPESYRIN